jgi:hypothetical protein
MELSNNLEGGLKVDGGSSKIYLDNALGRYLLATNE